MPNAWNEFRAKHKGKGYTAAELSAMYKAQKPAAGKKGTKAPAKKGAKAPARKAPAKKAAQPAAPKPMSKKTTTKKGTGSRLSAGAYYEKYGDAAVGHVCDIRGDGELKCLLLDKNGRPRWAPASKSGEGQEACGATPWSARCNEAVQSGGHWW